MKVLVTYISQTGNTKKVAQAIFEGLQEPKDIMELNRVTNLDGYDLVFVGFPIIAYKAAPDAVNFLDKYAAGKNVALFITHSAPENMPVVTAWIESCKAAAGKANLKGVFNCQGELGEQIANYMSQSSNPQLAAWAKQRPATIGQPDASRLNQAKAWGQQIVKSI
jgi:flavodoxin